MPWAVKVAWIAMRKTGQETVEGYQFAEPDQWRLRLSTLANKTIFESAAESNS